MTAFEALHVSYITFTADLVNVPRQRRVYVEHVPLPPAVVVAAVRHHNTLAGGQSQLVGIVWFVFVLTRARTHHTTSHHIAHTITHQRDSKRQCERGCDGGVGGHTTSTEHEAVLFNQTSQK
jgi:hypothetical protein